MSIDVKKYICNVALPAYTEREAIMCCAWARGCRDKKKQLHISFMGQNHAAKTSYVCDVPVDKLGLDDPEHMKILKMFALAAKEFQLDTFIFGFSEMSDDGAVVVASVFETKDKACHFIMKDLEGYYTNQGTCIKHADIGSEDFEPFYFLYQAKPEG